MNERRKQLRSRTLLGGVISFNRRRSTLDCSVRNLSDAGARIEFDNTALLPDTFDLTIGRKETTFRASMIWRTQTAAGVQFTEAHASGVVPLDWARKVKALEAQNEALRRRVAQLSEPAV
jgi:PilZ domain